MRELWLQLWITIVVALVLLALYVSLGRQLIPLLETYQPQAEQWLSQQLGQPVTMASMQGDWSGLSPLVRVSDLRVGADGAGLRVGHIEAQLDISASAFYRQPVFRRIEVTGVRVDAQEVSNNVWQFSDGWQLDLTALTQSSDASEQTTVSLSDRPAWLEWLELQHSILLRDWQLLGQGLKFSEELRLESVLWRNRGDSRVASGRIAWGTDGELANIRINGQLQGALWPWRQQQGQLFLQVDEQNWIRWIPDQLPQQLKVNTARAGLMAWLNLEQGQLQQVHGVLTLPELSLSTSADPLLLQRGVIKLDGKKSSDGWQARMRLSFADDFPINELYLSTLNMSADDGLENKGWQLQIPSLDLKQSAGFISRHGLLPDLWQRYVTGLNPRGRAEQTRLSWLVQQQQLQFELQAQLQEVSVDAYQGIPALTGASASLQLLPEQGRLRIRDDELSVWLADVYDQPWQLQQASADFVWAIHPLYYQLQLQQLKARLQGVPVTAEVGLSISSDEDSITDNLSVLVGVAQAPISLQQQLVPSLLDDELRQWLNQALLDGQLEQGMLALNGFLDEDSSEQDSSLELYLQAGELQLRYLPDWPVVTNLDGRLLLSSSDLDVWVDSAETLGGRFRPHSARLKVRQQDQQTWLNVVGQLDGDSSEALRYFTDTPLRQLIGGAADQWQGEGPLSAGLVLDMPLGSEAEPQVQLDVAISNNRLHLGELDITFEDVDGRLHFDNDSGLSSEQLSGRIFGGDFQATIASTPVAAGYDMSLQAEGQAQWSPFKQWLPVFLLDPISGGLNYQAQLNLSASQTEAVRFDLQSDLSGTEIDLPDPLGKTTEQARPLKLSVLPAEDTRIHLRYDDELTTVVALRDGELHRGQVYLGGSDAFLPSDPGVEVRGHIQQPIDAQQWFAVWQHMQALLAETNQSTSVLDLQQHVQSEYHLTSAYDNVAVESGPLRLIDLQLQDVDVWGNASGEARVQGQQQFGEWQFQIDSQLLAGKVQLAADPSLPMELTLDHIHMPASDDDGEEQSNLASVTPIDPLQGMNPADVPAFNMQLAELYIGSRNLGRWQLSSRPQPQGLRVEVDDSDLKGMKVLGNLDWTLTPTGHQTRLSDISMTSGDIGKVQRSFRQQEVVSAEDTRVLAELGWHGSPLGYDTRSLNGVVALRMRNGNMAAKGMEALKAFGVLNFNTISRRLQLDFSDLYQSGVTFDVLKAKAELNDGIMTLSEPLIMDGPGSKFWLSGSSNLNYQTLDMKLAVTFPVTGSLPIVAVLAGLAPPVAASIYVTERLIGDELERFTSASYTVRGTWSEPQLTINQAFDNEVDGKTSRSLGDRIRSIFGLGGDE